ncbi:MAG: tRNA (guanosine(46)-N7)-methyltransferase TrmB [Maritimibacter sp.]
MQDDHPTHHPSGAPWRNFYGRFRGKTMRSSQFVYLEEDLPGLVVPGVEWDENPERTKINPADLFGDRPLWVEIGFGGGEHLVHQAETHPEVGIIGCEPFVNGVAMMLGTLRKSEANNVRVHPGDARNLFDVLPDGSVEKAFLLYPDPWPKARHHRRRFVTQDHLEPLFRVLAPGAEFRVATDIQDYVRQTMEEVPRAGFEWTATSAQDWRTPWADWISTRYEQKAYREGRRPHYMTFRKPA